MDKYEVWSSIVSQSGGKILGHFRNKGFEGKGFRFWAGVAQ